MIEAILKYGFMQNALLASLLGGIISAVIGTIIVEKKLISMSGGLAHASFGGIGAAYYFGVEPLFGGIAFAILSVLSVRSLKKSARTLPDTLMHMLWAAGMAVGILFIAFTPGYPPDMTSYLFGDILTVTKSYLWLMSALTIIVLLCFIPYFQYWKMYLFDEEYASVIDINIAKLETILYIILAVSIVILVKVVGIILAIAMLTIPASTVKLFNHSLSKIMIQAAVLSIINSVLGLYVSYKLNIPSGATIILVGLFAYILTSVVVKFGKRRE